MLSAFCLMAPATAHAQNPSATGPSDQKTTATKLAPLAQIHYETRVRSFKEQNRLLQNVVLLGDSITEGFDIEKYLPGRRILNRGIGSDVIGNDLPSNDKRGVIKRLDSSVFNCAPTDVFILIGINDLGQGHTPETVESGYREMLSRIRKHRPELNLYIQSVLPCRDRFAKHNANILDVNRRLQKLATEFDAKYIDLHSSLTDGDGMLKQEYTNDGLHLTEPGYHVWKVILAEELGWQ